MDFRLVSADEGLDIMPFVNGLKWSESIDTLGLEMSFTLPDNFNDKYFNFLDNICALFYITFNIFNIII